MLYNPPNLADNAVTINVTAPPSDEAPITCKANIPIFTLALELNLASLNGGYNVHPAESPSSRAIDNTTSMLDNSSN